MKCITCKKEIQPFSPSSTYCSKVCEKKTKDPAVADLMNFFGMK